MILMKCLKHTLVTIAAVGLMISCADADADVADAKEKSKPVGSEIAAVEEKTEVELIAVKEPDIIDPQPTEEIVSKYNYDVDFDLIKTAILAKDGEFLSSFCDSESVNVDEVLMYFGDPSFAELLIGATYDSLQPLENELQEIELVWSGLSTYTNDEGNNYESGVYMYFKQGDLNLELVKVLVAG
jgi:hypothetical protein